MASVTRRVTPLTAHGVRGVLWTLTAHGVCGVRCGPGHRRWGRGKRSSPQEGDRH